jgi:hypothetical protein
MALTVCLKEANGKRGGEGSVSELSYRDHLNICLARCRFPGFYLLFRLLLEVVDLCSSPLNCLESIINLR